MVSNERWESMQREMRASIDQNAEKAFEAWKAKVDAAIISRCGLTSDDLPDYRYRDEFEDGATPRMTANRALRNSGMRE